MSNEGVIIFDYLNEMVQREASDLYMTVGLPATLRKDNNLFALSADVLDVDRIDMMLSEVLTSRQRREFDTNLELNLALDMGDRGRFRINVLRQKQFPALVIRRITSNIPSFEDLTLPAHVFEKLSMERRGLILVSGVTSSGKSTSLASMINYRNQHAPGHIITIEDPVEYFHTHKKCIITQREVGIDTQSYHVGLKNALRQKPDVIMIGEIRDAEVMDQALGAAETGHLCLATIHTNNASQAIERMINFFPEEKQNQVRINLSMNLRAIIGQRLVSTEQGGVALAMEILLNEALIKEHILKGETTKIRDVMANNNTSGMVTFDQSLFKLFQEGRISEERAIADADIPGDMRMKIHQTKVDMSNNTSDEIDTSRLSL